MLNPDLRNLLKDNTSRYSVVTAVAKRAREITQECEDTGKVIIEKPVDLAVRDFVSGKYKINE